MMNREHRRSAGRRYARPRLSAPGRLCKKGYGVYTADGKYLKLDAAGDMKALSAIEASKKMDNFKVRVTVDVDGDSIKVTNLSHSRAY
jgi:hypothetical protein